jgi:hypothetical protein
MQSHAKEQPKTESDFDRHDIDQQNAESRGRIDAGRPRRQDGGTFCNSTHKQLIRSICEEVKARPGLRWRMSTGERRVSKNVASA